MDAVDIDVGEGLDAFELMLGFWLVVKGYFLNNGLGMTLLLIDNLTDAN